MLGLSFAGLVAAGPVLFSVTPVAAPAGYSLPVGFGFSINNLGQVAGVASGPGNTFVPFIATGSSSVAVPFPVDQMAQQVFINNAGQIAGWASVPSAPDVVSFTGNAAGTTLVPVPLVAGEVPPASLAGLNNSGQIVGTLLTNSPEEAFVGTSGGVSILPYQVAIAINDLGQVLVADQNQTLILSGGNSTLVPGILGGLPIGLNDAGQVVGVGSNPQLGDAFVATIGGIVFVPNPPGFNRAINAYINDSGVVVGSSVPVNGAGTAWIWDPVNGTRLLSDLVPAGWSILGSGGINDQGQIVAFASFTDPGGPGNSQSIASFSGEVVLSPTVPEPGTFAMSFAAIAVFGAVWIIRRRRPV